MEDMVREMREELVRVRVRELDERAALAERCDARAERRHRAWESEAMMAYAAACARRER